MNKLLFSVLELIAVGLAALWLLGHTLAKRNRFVSVLLAAVILGAVGFLATLFQGGISVFSENFFTLVFYGISAAVLLIGLAISAFFSRRRFTVRSFMLRLPVWSILAGVAVMFVYVGFFFAFSRMVYDYAGEVFMQAMLVGAVIGVLSYLMLVPFLILTFTCKFYRSRLYAVLRLKGMEEASNEDMDRNIERKVE